MVNLRHMVVVVMTMCSMVSSQDNPMAMAVVSMVSGSRQDNSAIMGMVVMVKWSGHDIVPSRSW